MCSIIAAIEYAKTKSPIGLFVLTRDYFFTLESKEVREELADATEETAMYLCCRSGSCAACRLLALVNNA